MSKSKKNLTGGQAAVKSLKKEKVEHVFGLIGSATMEMFDALYHEKTIKFIGVRDERTGTHMADGYARASNKPGVILAGQNGPGATNLVTGIAQAKAAFSPVVAIAGSFSTKDKMEDAFQGLDQQSLFKPITKKTWTITNAKKIPKVFSAAFNTAMTPRRGPVCINVPRNILSDTSKFNINQSKKSYNSESSLKAKSNAIKKSVKIIVQSTKPGYLTLSTPQESEKQCFPSTGVKIGKAKLPLQPLTLVDIFAFPGYYQNDRYFPELYELLNEKEVQREYGINARTLQRERIYQNGIPYHKIGRRVFYRRSDIEEFLATCKIGQVVRYD